MIRALSSPPIIGSLGEGRGLEVFKWLSAVTYALVGALTFKLILLPIGQLAQVPIAYRILVSFICLVYVVKFKAGLSRGLILGCILMAGYGLYISYG